MKTLLLLLLPGLLTDKLELIPTGTSHALQRRLGVWDAMHDRDWFHGLCPCGATR